MSKMIGGGPAGVVQS